MARLQRIYSCCIFCFSRLEVFFWCGVMAMGQIRRSGETQEWSGNALWTWEQKVNPIAGGKPFSLLSQRWRPCLKLGKTSVTTLEPAHLCYRRLWEPQDNNVWCNWAADCHLWGCLMLHQVSKISIGFLKGHTGLFMDFLLVHDYFWFCSINMMPHIHIEQLRHQGPLSIGTAQWQTLPRQTCCYSPYDLPCRPAIRSNEQLLRLYFK